MDLQKASRSVVEDGLIIQGLSQAIVMGEVPINTNFWISDGGICLATTMVGSGVVIICLIYFSVRLHNLAVTVALLRASLNATKEADSP